MQETIARIRKFRDDRDWKQFHDPKNLAVSISIEAAELLELFQWKTGEEARQFAEDVMRMEVRRRQVQQGGAMLVSDHF